ncbi:right-handed parallel beta-helix repeat-containing protein [Pseudomaricurvus alkylphenolicus]|uniref:right-handed parallel beta-helix repeat-containing protein n=1 Tax=Pseudomaricurvus alkylphenolicus TaxID=1306991 RepID=UPI001423092A|nr:right-handed parallel beta-helix repeat-containing protein [Pseudomaricurvus alkylphenolicus]NIB43111.1 right-handed parallel beta-helix repeat-containing protein [Pseudomaricurvus alkylphenolicus]
MKTSLLGTAVMRCLGLTLLGIVGWSLVQFPSHIEMLVFWLCAYAVVLCFLPSVWLLVIPAALPVLDLTLWTGRVYWGEFDFLILTTVAVSLIRAEPWLRALQLRKRAWLLIALVTGWQLVVTCRGLLPLQPIDSNSFTSFYSPYNGLRLAKGYFEALLLLVPLGQALERDSALHRWVVAGMAGSFAVGALALIWERALFTGLFNFSTPYRATGLFSGTSIGGAAVDAHLLLTLPFVLLLPVVWKRIWVYIFAALILVAGLYGSFITFSRANYPAALASLLILVLSWIYANRRSWRPSKSWLMGGAIMSGGVIMLAIFSAPYIQSRFTTTFDDLNTRFEHWSHVANIMDSDVSTQMFGMGKGRFPITYYWNRPKGDHYPQLTHEITNDETFVRLSRSGTAGNLFLRQRFVITEPGPYRLHIQLKPLEARKESLLMEVCERLVFQAFRECRWYKVKTSADNTTWEEHSRNININRLGKTYWYGTRPVEIAILNRGIKQGIDIKQVQLLTPGGKQLFSNTDFSSGLDHWSVYSGDHLAWHVKNIWVDAYFEGGWLGLASFLLLLLGLTAKLWIQISRGNFLAGAAASALVGGLMVGLFDSLFDDPKITLLFFLLCWIALNSQAYNLLVSPTTTTLMKNWTMAEIRMCIETTRARVFGLRSHPYGIYIFLCLVPVIGLILYVFIERFVHHRHWMWAWNSVVADETQSLDHGPAFVSGTHAPGTILVDGVQANSLREAFRGVKDGSLIQIGAGAYNEAAVLKADNVKLIASPGAVIFGKAAKGKAAIVTKGRNIYIDGLECHSVKVADRNGACIRMEKGSLSLNRVYFHHAQSGVLQTPGAGELVVENSRFENLGDNPYAHAIYSSGSKLIVRNSVFLNQRGGGHEIKSRSKYTEITGSVIAASIGDDSRLVDIPNGGDVIMRDNVFVEGVASQNADLFSWSVEKSKYTGDVIIENNIIVSDKPVANLLSTGDEPELTRIENNVVVGNIWGIDDDYNTVFESREQAGLEVAPNVPRLGQYPMPNKLPKDTIPTLSVDAN